MTENIHPWIKATASGAENSCVELRPRIDGPGVQLRDSKDPSGPILNFTAKELAAFIDGARKGEFDHLI